MFTFLKKATDELLGTHDNSTECEIVLFKPDAEYNEPLCPENGFSREESFDSNASDESQNVFEHGVQEMFESMNSLFNWNNSSCDTSEADWSKRSEDYSIYGSDTERISIESTKALREFERSREQLSFGLPPLPPAAIPQQKKAVISYAKSVSKESSVFDTRSIDNRSMGSFRYSTDSNSTNSRSNSMSRSMSRSSVEEEIKAIREKLRLLAMEQEILTKAQRDSSYDVITVTKESVAASSTQAPVPKCPAGTVVLGKTARSGLLCARQRTF